MTTTSHAPLPLGTDSERAADAYRRAIDCVHGAYAGAAELLDEAIECDPGLAAAQAARWMLASGAGDTGVADAARQAALGATGGAASWEAGHVQALGALIERRDDAVRLAREHLQRHPRDLLVASQLAGELFFHGGAGKRRAALELFSALAPYHADDWAFHVRLGFHLSEAGEVAAALPHLEAALEARPDAPYVAHSMAHALLESDARERSAQFLDEWIGRHDVSGPLDGHIHWHVALGELESGDADAAIARYRRHVAPGVSQCAAGLMLADAGGLLLRLSLEGVGSERLPRDGLRALLEGLRGALGVPFVGVHAAALLAALDDAEALSDCVQAIAAQTSHRYDGVPERAATALLAFARGDRDAAVEALERDRADDWEALGGSNEERALMASVYEHARANA